MHALQTDLSRTFSPPLRMLSATFPSSVLFSPASPTSSTAPCLKFSPLSTSSLVLLLLTSSTLFVPLLFRLFEAPTFLVIILTTSCCPSSCKAFLAALRAFLATCLTPSAASSAALAFKPDYISRL